jgi:hypothetical protein
MLWIFLTEKRKRRNFFRKREGRKTAGWLKSPACMRGGGALDCNFAKAPQVPESEERLDTTKEVMSYIT